MKENRKTFNVNKSGYYKGGVPVKYGNYVRGDALSSPGDLHTTGIHNHYKDCRDEDLQIDVKVG